MAFSTWIYCCLKVSMDGENGLNRKTGKHQKMSEKKVEIDEPERDEEIKNEVVKKKMN